MSSRAARHPVVLFPLLIVAMLAGAVLVGSTVEYLAVGTSRLGLDSSSGLGVSIAGALLAMAAVVVILFLALGTDQGFGRDDEGDWGDDVPPAPTPPKDRFGEPLWWSQFEEDFDAYVRGPAAPRREAEPERLPALR